MKLAIHQNDYLEIQVYQKQANERKKHAQNSTDENIIWLFKFEVEYLASV